MGSRDFCCCLRILFAGGHLGYISYQISLVKIVHVYTCKRSLVYMGAQAYLVSMAPVSCSFSWRHRRYWIAQPMKLRSSYKRSHRWSHRAFKKSMELRPENPKRECIIFPHPTTEIQKTRRTL